jgi:hypothetical protein
LKTATFGMSEHFKMTGLRASIISHRKQIKMREKCRGKTSVPFNMKTITDDKKTNKIVSHKRLQAEILDEETSIYFSVDLQLQKIV